MNYGYQGGYNNLYQPQQLNQNYIPNYSNYNPYNNQQFGNQTQQTQNMNEPSIQLCDSKDYVKSQNVRMDGQSSYYALTDGSSIFCKKLNPQTGASMLLTYQLQNETENIVKNDVDITSLISNLKSEISNEIAEIKNIVLDNLTSPKKGGEK